jgi:hypothetical protein
MISLALIVGVIGLVLGRSAPPGGPTASTLAAAPPPASSFPPPATPAPTSVPTAVPGVSSSKPELIKTCTFEAGDNQAIDFDSCTMIPFVVSWRSPPSGVDITLGNNGRLSTNSPEVPGLVTLLDPSIESCIAAIASQSGFTDILKNGNNALFEGSSFCMITGRGATVVVSVTKPTPVPAGSSFAGGISLQADLYQ